MNDNEEITESDNLIKYTITDQCYSSANGYVGNAISKKVEASIIGADKYDLENKEIEVFAGIGFDDRAEYLTFGKFIVGNVEVNEVKNQIIITGYDYMIKFNKTYVDTNTYPVTLKDFLINLCNQVGAELSEETFVNEDFVINQNPFTNSTTWSTVLSEVAKMACGYAHIDRDNKLHIKNIECGKGLKVGELDVMTIAEVDVLKVVKMREDGGLPVDEQIDGNCYFDISKQKRFGRVNELIVQSNIEDVDDYIIRDDYSINKYGYSKYSINAVAFVTTKEELQQVSENIWSEIKWFEYTPCKLKYYGFPYLDVGDKIKLIDLKNNEYRSFVFNYTFTFDGHFSGTISTDALTQTQQTYQNYSSFTAVMNKQKSKTLEEAKKNATQLITEFNGGYVVKRAGELYISDNIDLDKAKRVWRWNINGLGYSSTGVNGEYGLAMTMDGSIVADFINAGVLNSSVLKGVTFTAGGKDNEDGIIQVLDSSGNIAVEITKNGITLADGKEIVGGKGLLGNLQYRVEGNDFLGYTLIFEDYTKGRLVIDAYIPENFTISEAKVTLMHRPVYWNYATIDEGTEYFWGYSRNIRLYATPSIDTIISATAMGGGIDETYYEGNFIEIAGAFGENGFTAKTPSDTSYEQETIISINIKDYLVTGRNILVIQTENEPPVAGDIINPNLQGYEQTGEGSAVLNVIGYMK